MKQGGDEWFAARLGRLTASRMADVIATTKAGYSASRAGYAVELALERITGHGETGFTNAAMQWGTDTEPLARAAYEMHTGDFVSLAGFVGHPTIEMAGASPDGFVGADGLVEIKCPERKQHLAYIRDRKAPSKYLPQIHWQLACTGRQWCDFVSYDPRFPMGLQLMVVRVRRDADEVKRLESEAVKFLDEVSAIVADLESMKEAT